MPETPVTIITGAGSGIGRAVCELLATAGHRLALVGRSEERLEETIRAIATRSANPPDVLVVPADVSEARQAASVVEVTLAEWGRVDAVVNNAGIAPLEPIESTDEDLLYRTFAVNTFGPAHIIARVWPVFRRQRTGCLVNVSSIAASDPFPGFFVYASTKSALESLTRSAAREGAEHGIRAWSVAPGAVETAALRRLFDERVIPPDRVLAPATVAEVISDCVLGRRSEPSGTTIAVPSP